MRAFRLCAFTGALAAVAPAATHDVPTLGDETPTQARVFAGGHFNFGIVDFTIEGDHTGKTTTVSGRLGFRF